MNPTTPLVRALRVLALLAALTPLGVPAAAQQPAKQPVVIGIPDAFPRQGARAMVFRYASAGNRDVVLLDGASATPEALAAAVLLVRDLRRSHPKLKDDQVATLTRFTPPRGLDPRTLSALASRLEELKRRPSSRIGSLGSGRWIELADASLNP
ncbi:MAG TPA: hypothetical protein VF263_01410 [Longimicrobiaceae bacterium]